MASQTAQIISNFGSQVAATSGSGLRDAAGSISKAIAGKQGYEEQKIDKEIKQTQLDTLKANKVIDAIAPTVHAANTPEKWAKAQQGGFLQPDMKFEDREPFLFKYFGDKALNTVEVAAKDGQGTEFVSPWNVAGRKGKPQSSLVSINQAQETEESKAFGKSLVSDYDSIKEKANNSATALQQYQMAKNIDVETSGALEPWKVAGVALAEGLGVDTGMLDRATNAQAFQGIMENMVLSKMQAQKGPQTENDTKRIQSTLASLGNTEDARIFLLDAGEALERENIEKQQFWSKWRETHNGTFEGAQSAWNKFKDKTPFLAKNPNTGRPVFFSQYIDRMRQANPDAEYADFVDLWQKKYGKSN
jgi:hypothetical protein